MKTFNTLYKKTANGSIQVWWCELTEDRYRMCSGKLDGKIIKSEWTVCQSKNVGRSNMTTAAQQAELEVKAAYTKKLKTGYHREISAASTDTKQRPMLARNYEDFASKLFVEHEIVFSQPKLDGIRCLATPTGLYSRNGNKIVSCPHIESYLRESGALHDDIILDGELYSHDLADNFNKIASLVKKLKPTAGDLIDSEMIIQLRLFDVITPSNRYGYASRHQLLTDYFSTDDTEDVSVLEYDAVETQDELDYLYEDYVTSGYEGQMIRIPTGVYEGKRSKFLLKRKGIEDAEFIVLDITEGVGNRTGMAGYATLDLGKGRSCTANIKGTQDFLRALLKSKKKYVGHPATVEFQNWTPDGSLRFPRVTKFWPGGRNL